MPTDIIKTIGATSSPVVPDYSTLQAWEDAAPANLVTSDQRWIGECLDQGEFVVGGIALSVGGSTVDATRYKLLRCASGASFTSKSGVRTTALAYSASNGVAIRTTANYSQVYSNGENYTTLIGLQLKADSITSSGFNSPGSSTASVNTRIEQCIVHANGNLIGNTRGIIQNCLLIGTKSTASGVRIDSSLVKIRGTTLVNTTVGGSSGTGILLTYNGPGDNIIATAIFGFAATSSAGNAFTGSNNATDKSSVGFGSSNQVNLVFASQFQSSTNDFRAVASGSLDLNGVTDANIPTDITGLARDATTPTIGCWEVAGASTSPITGSTSFTLTPAATIAGRAAAAGSSTIAFSPSASIGGRGVLSGAASVAFATSGEVLGRGDLVGASALSFVLSASIGGIVQLTGTASLALSVVADIRGIGELSGIAQLQLASAGDIDGLGSLSGFTTITFALNGNATLPAEDFAALCCDAWAASIPGAVAVKMFEQCVSVAAFLPGAVAVRGGCGCGCK